MRTHRIRIVACAGLLLGAGVACQKGSQIEAGAVLLSLTVAPGAPTPDELRASIYDDTGALWQDARIPTDGSLPAASAGRLGTVLIQPGASQGPLRIDVRGLVGGSPMLEGLLVLPPGQRGSFNLTLAGNLSPDADGDGVPDQIDDCPTVPDPGQTGCPRDAAVDRTDSSGGGGRSGGGGAGAASGHGGGGGAGGHDGGGDAVGEDAADADGGCNADGGCAKAVGALCGAGVQCASSFCVDGVCCATACLGACRSCNQPSSNGICKAYAQGTDPEVDCTGAKSCNGAGACGSPPDGGAKTNGEVCGGALECSSGFCSDGVCCDSACTSACQTCATGSCQKVKKSEDVPECAAPMTCNAQAKCVAQ